LGEKHFAGWLSCQRFFNFSLPLWGALTKVDGRAT